MANTSTNISLTLPELSDTTKIREDFNDNFNIIDGRFSATYMAVQAAASVAITGGSITGITDITVADGGTGASTLTDGGVLLGSGTGAITAMAVLTDGQMIVGNGTTDPVAESGATLRTSIGCAAITQTMYIGTTAVAINRASAALTLAGITLTTPDIGVATATSINKVTITTPATSATLTLVTGSSLITAGAYAITLTSTATTGVTLPTSGTLYSTKADSITSAQLATSITNETGTGVLVFGTAPTFTTSITVASVVLPTLFTDSTEPTGFTDKTATLSFVPGASGVTREFTITGAHYIYINGVKTTKATDTIAITDSTGLYYIYYNVSGVLAMSTVHPEFTLPLIATVYWNTTTDAYLLGEERHGISMSGETHELLHNTIGVRYETGLTLTANDTTFTVTAGTIYDEDLDIDITEATTCNILYKNGTANFEWDAAQTTLYKLNGANLRYNSTNDLADVGSNAYVAYWVFATNDTTTPIVSLMGQRTDTNIANARIYNKYESLELGTLPFQEMKLLYRVIFRNDADPYEEVQDLRTVSNLPAGTYIATQHNALTGLTWATSGHNGLLDLDNRLTAGTLTTPIDVSTNTYGVAWYYSGNNQDVTALRSRGLLITTDSAKTAQGAVLQASNSDGINALCLNGALIEAIGKSTSAAANIGTMRGALVGVEWGEYDIITTNMMGLHVRVHTKNSATRGYISGTGNLLYLENEAVGGNGQQLNAGIYLKATNVSTPYAFDYGIDLSGAAGEIATADIILQNGEVIENKTDGKITFTGELTGDGGGLTGLPAGYTDLTEFVDQNTWKVFYSDGSGDVIELALGADGTYLESNGASSAPTFTVPAGAGDVSKVGTPADSQVGVWTGDGTIEGDASLTYDRSNLQLTGDIGSTGSRITKGWFTDLAVTDTITISGTAAKGIEITGANTTAQLYISGTNILANGEQAIWINCAGEDGATNGMWISLGSTVVTGDLTGARIKVTTNAISGGGAVSGQNTRGVYAQAIGAAGDDAGLLQGGLFVADVSAGTVTAYNVHVLCGHYSSGATAVIGGDLYVGYLRAQTRSTDPWSVGGQTCLLALENEAVEGNGAVIDSAIRIFDTNVAASGFTYGIDLSDSVIATADIRLSNGETISNTTDGTITIGGILQLGGNLVAADNNITGLGSASFTQELDNGTKTTHFSVDFSTDQKQKVTLTANTMTLTLDTTSVGVGNYTLKIVNGGLATLTWASESGSIYFPGGTDPSLTSSGTDIVALYFDGTNWHGASLLDFK